MERLESTKNCQYYTFMKQFLIDLGLDQSDYNWLVTDIEAFPRTEEYRKFIDENAYFIMSTKDLMNMLEKDDFQWIWAVFSAIPSQYSEEDILKYELPVIRSIKNNYNPFVDEPKLQHPLAEIEFGLYDSTGMFMITDKKRLLTVFKAKYPAHKNEPASIRYKPYSSAIKFLLLCILGWLLTCLTYKLSIVLLIVCSAVCTLLTLAVLLIFCFFVEIYDDSISFMQGYQCAKYGENTLNKYETRLSPFVTTTIRYSEIKNVMQTPDSKFLLIEKANGDRILVGFLAYSKETQEIIAKRLLKYAKKPDAEQSSDAS